MKIKRWFENIPAITDITNITHILYLNLNKTCKLDKNVEL